MNRRIFFCLFLITCFVLSSFVTESLAAPAPQHPVQARDAAGNTFMIQLHGDEFVNWATLPSAGNMMVAMASDGNWYFAVSWDFDAARAVPGAVRAAFGLAPEKTMSAPPAEAFDRARKERLRFQQGTSGDKKSKGAPAGVFPRPVLVFNVEYTGTSVGAPRPSEEEVASYFFGSGARSVKDYWASLGAQITPGQESSGTPDNGVINVTLSGTVPYKPQDADTGPLVIYPVLDAAKASINLAQFDANHDGTLTGDEVQLVFFLTQDNNTGVWPSAFMLDSTYPLTNIQGLNIGVCQGRCRVSPNFRSSSFLSRHRLNDPFPG